MRTPEEIAEFAAWQAFALSKTRKKMFTQESLAAHIAGAIKGDRIDIKTWASINAHEVNGSERYYIHIDALNAELDRINALTESEATE